MKLTKKTFNPR